VFSLSDVPKSSRRILAAAALAAAGLLTTAPPGHAAFAGRNGSVTYDGRWSQLGLLSLRKPNGSGLRQIHVPGQPADPTFSPFGRRIAFTTNGQIWAMYADGTGQRQITALPVPATAPAWSPNGEQLVFVGGTPGTQDLYRIAADGSGLRKITRSPTDDDHPAWSIRNRIAFVRHTARGDGDIRTMVPSGGDTVRVTHGTVDDESPVWSPDGRWIAFTRGRPSTRDLYVIRRDGTHLRRVVNFKDGVSSPAWSPDGRWIAFAMGRSGKRGLYRVRLAGGKAKRVSPNTADAATVDWQVKGADPVIAAAGDIACEPTAKNFNGGYGTTGRCHQMETSNLLLKMDLSAVLALGDTQYETGASAAFSAFDQSWGRVKSLIRPAVGNHESRDPGATGYYDYFNGPGVADGVAGHRGEGWHSFDVGRWHLIALNSECSYPPDAPTMVECAAGSPQERWLQADLAAHPSQCTLAYFHHPLVTSGLRQTFNSAVQPLWRDLQAAHADVVLVGHDHAYERFAPINADGAVDPVNGMREFIVGTGGKNFDIQDFHRPGSELRQSSVFGVLEMQLGRGFYRWQFVPEAHGHFTDSGEQACH
jgi:acid phosphatase type 7